MTDAEYFTYIGKNKVWIHWSDFVVHVGNSKNWAYHARPNYVSEIIRNDEGRVIDERLRRLEKDEVLDVPIYEPEEALKAAFQKYIDSLGVEE